MPASLPEIQVEIQSGNEGGWESIWRWLMEPAKTDCPGSEPTEAAHTERDSLPRRPIDEQGL
jgi:hypothetical protein